MGGNWADEYPTSGYTLYDNVLRYWHLREARTFFKDEILQSTADPTYELLKLNLNSTKHLTETYQQKAYKKL